MKDSVTYREETGCGPMYVACIHEKGKLRAVDIVLGKSGSCAMCHISTLQCALNEILRLSGNVNNLINIVEQHSCHKGNCCVDKVAESLKAWKVKYFKVP